MAGSREVDRCYSFCPIVFCCFAFFASCFLNVDFSFCDESVASDLTVLNS